MMNMWLIIFILYMVGNMIFVYKHKHLLIMLLSLEYIVLSMFMMLMLYLSFIEFDMYLLMVFLVFSVCEGALGISILVSMIRTHGNDYFQSFSLL
uniref:NADH dehydrogenase subunit 4L n=1 Tax=Erynnis popoviana TaxID=2913264 RepID=UPI001EE05643|nr:NADH dehydrogenase subunit 4L [Erynnis popoviana]UJV31604.1 NADH dehydrogenase subunit 4L [Erynnis popoviana]